jgi:PIN domain nuclease of toxin-antitoxin system
VGRGQVKLLLDTHALIWWFLDDPRLSTKVDQLLDEPSAIIHVSGATAWEIATKFRIGKLQEAAAIVTDFPGLVARCHFVPLPVTIEHGHHAGLLVGDHKDPFDRMLAAQAIIEDLGLVTADPAMAGLGARLVW